MTAGEFYSRLRAKHALSRGERMLAAGTSEKAAPLFERAAELAASDPALSRRAHDRAAETLLRLNKKSEALPHLRALTAPEGAGQADWLRLAETLESLSDWDAAI